MALARGPLTRSASAAPGRSTNIRCFASNSPPPPPSRDYKVALITGGNTGIGFETAKSLAQQGYYVVLACRDQAKAESARARLKDLVPTARGVEIAQLDLADLGSVRAWASRAQDMGLPLDVLVNNAGVMMCPELTTKDGFELQLGVNHLGHYLLTTMLLPLMVGTGRSSRIVNVSSVAHLSGAIEFDDLDGKRKGYSPWRAYAQSKLANVLFSYELARRLPAAGAPTVNALHPGVVNTELGRYLIDQDQPAAWWQRPLVAGMQALALSPAQGAATSIYLASSPEVEGVTGKYWDKCRAVTSSKESYDTAVAARFWDLSAELVGAQAADPPVGTAVLQPRGGDSSGAPPSSSSK